MSARHPRASELRQLELTPRAALGRWPFRGHRSMAAVMEEEAPALPRAVAPRPVAVSQPIRIRIPQHTLARETSPEPEFVRAVVLPPPSPVMTACTGPFPETPALRLAREFGMVKASPKIDWSKIADAHARRPISAPVHPAAPKVLEAASSREPCPRCGIPGWKGCAHFLPCEDGPPLRADEAAERRETRFTGRRRGVGVLRI